MSGISNFKIRRRKIVLVDPANNEESDIEDIFLKEERKINPINNCMSSSSDEETNLDSFGQSLTEESNKLSFLSYCWSELTSGYSLENDQIRYTEKRRKLHALFRIPLTVESFLFFGMIQCIDAFLYIFTFLPIRFLISFFRWKHWGSAEMCDFLKIGIIVCSTSVMLYVDTSVIYHVVRSQGIIKLYIIYNMLEVVDKLLSSLGQDILEALFWTADEPFSLKTVVKISYHFLLATIYGSAHSFLVLLQATTLNVAFNSHNQSLLAILMSNNFVELKGSVFKKFAKANLFQMTCSDVRERFHLLALITVVFLRNMVAVNWSKEDLLNMMPDVFMVITAEVLIDWLKHIFITKFNEINADVYKDFSMTTAFDVVKNRDAKGAFNAYSDQVSRRMGFIPIPLSVMLIRVLGQTFNFNRASTLFLVAIFWLILFAIKIGNGILLLGKACQYVIAFRKLQSCAKEQISQHKLQTMKSKSEPNSPKMSLIDFTDVCHQPNGKQDFTASDILDQLYDIQKSVKTKSPKMRKTHSLANISRVANVSDEVGEGLGDKSAEDNKSIGMRSRRTSSKCESTENDLATVQAYQMLPPEKGVERIE